MQEEILLQQGEVVMRSQNAHYNSVENRINVSKQTYKCYQCRSTFACFCSVKSIWWIPRHKMTMKDVARCDKSRGGPKQPLIRESPNGGTQLG